MISLTIPPDADALAVLRATASAIAARAGLTLDQLDDVRMAVEEAAVVLLPLGHDMTMHVDPGVQPFAITMEVAAGSTLERDPESLSWMVLDGVTEQAELTAAADRTAVQLTFGPVTSAA